MQQKRTSFYCRLAALPVLDDPKEELNVSDMQQNLSDIYEDLPGEKC